MQREGECGLKIIIVVVVIVVVGVVTLFGFGGGGHGSWFVVRMHEERMRRKEGVGRYYSM